MKVLIISGSPRSEGICHSLVEAALDSSKETGAEAEVIKLSSHKLEQCKMCGEGWGTCRSEHRCQHGDSDGFNMLQEKFSKADAFVFITPVYWGDVSEAFKGFFDKLRRCQASKRWSENENTKSFFTDKPSILVASAGGSGNGIINTLTQMERAIVHMGGDGMPKEEKGIYDYIAVNRWNKDYKLEALKASVASMIKSNIKA